VRLWRCGRRAESWHTAPGTPGRHGDFLRRALVGIVVRVVQQGGGVHVRHYHRLRQVAQERCILRLQQPATDAEPSTAAGALVGAARLGIHGANAATVKHEITGHNDTAVWDTGRRRDHETGEANRL
jgi:hypothetical protein